jgi:penicillin G amidase
MQQMISADHPLWNNAELGSSDRAQLIEMAMGQAWDFMSESYGDDPQAWSWGAMHGTNFVHGLSDFAPEISALFNRSTPINGGITSVNRQPWHPQNDSFDVDGAAASMRMVADLSNPDLSRFIIPVGQSGDPASPHYADQMPLWASGNYPPHAFSSEAVDALTIETWVFVP